MNTPLEKYPELGEKIGVSSLYFKREDLSPYGSHKGRSIPVMIDTYAKKGDGRFAISSSGNAALAAAIHIQKLNNELRNDDSGSDRQPFELDIFVGNHITENKFSKLQKYADEKIRILKKERPLQALTQAVNDGARSLRQSTDDLALKGYESLAQELVEEFDSKKTNKEKLGAIFIGTSSGTTAQALAQFFLDHNSTKNIPQIHIVQTSSCHPLSLGLNSYDGPDEKSIADAITDISAMRKTALIPLIEKTGGGGWFATNDDIETAQILTEKHANLAISNNSALSVAGVIQAVYAGHDIDGAVICLICGE
jgi:threonine dehydratase